MHLEDTGSGAVHERLDSDCNVNESAAKTPQLDAALEYARRGWPIFPCGGDKKPRTKHGFLDASADEQKVRSWWTKWPKASIGLACGAAGVFVVDLDVDKEKGLDAVSLFEQLRDSRRHGSGLVVRTPRGGRHLYYRMPTPAVTSTSRGEKHATLPGVDLRGEGGYAILPSPADPKRIFEDGDIEDIGEAPAWILEELVAEHRVGPRSEKKEKTASKGPTVDEGRGRLSMRELVDIAGALERVDGAERDNWLRVGMALRSTGDPGARFLWERWSLQWPERFNGANQDETWSSLKETRPDGREVTIATLFHMAKAATPAASAAPDMHWPADIGAVAHIGAAGRFLELVAPQTEADPNALLVQFLVFYGNAVGRSPHVRIGGMRHGTNLFAIVAGNTSRGRKGTSEAEVRRAMRMADEDWSKTCVLSGLSSGEGVIDAIRDAREEFDAKKGKSYTIPGKVDKRLMVSEGEFARVLAQVCREGNVLSSVLRQAWDSETLRIMTRTSPASATDPHISTVAHVTRHELLMRMSETDLFNGLGNRFLWCCSKRSKLLPLGGYVDPNDLEQLGDEIRRSLSHARRQSEVRFTAAGKKFWVDIYEQLGAERPGLWGALTARSEAQVRRLSLIFAMLDCAAEVDVAHLQAALEVWRYCDESARYLFGDKIGQPVADKLMAAIRAAGASGLSRSQLSAALGRNVPAAQIDAALQILERGGMASKGTVGEGRSASEVWRAT
jgi:Bifunctional DNA primase/polymerase, N-terminal/Primase C terminal 2 (PriCT-2)